MFQTKFVEKIKTHILSSKTFFYESHAVYEIMWKNMLQRGRPQMTISTEHALCMLNKHRYTHLQYLILIAFPQHQ